MGLRARHGSSARNRNHGSVVEVQPLDEQSPGVQARVLPIPAGEHKPNGQIAKGAKVVPGLGGKAKKHRVALSADPAIKEALAAPEFRPMLRKGSEFRKGIMRQLASTCGGGECDKLTGGVVSIAADQLAASKFFTAKAAKSLDPADFLTASRLGDACRQNLIAARELAVKHGEAMKRSDPHNGLSWLLAPAASTPAQDASAGDATTAEASDALDASTRQPCASTREAKAKR